jgi:hypothetical protein
VCRRPRQVSATIPIMITSTKALETVSTAAPLCVAGVVQGLFADLSDRRVSAVVGAHLLREKDYNADLLESAATNCQRATVLMRTQCVAGSLRNVKLSPPPPKLRGSAGRTME